MDNRFYISHWEAPLSPSSVMKRGVPTNLKPKVVSIPVQFVLSERTHSDSALRIQKVFRGFLLRKGMKKIAQIRKELSEIETRVSDKEIAELVMKEPKERLKVAETIMNLLLRLDSVNGINPCVRDCRKTLIKKAIALQDNADSIIPAAQKPAKTVTDDASDNENAEGKMDLGLACENQETHCANRASELPKDAESMPGFRPEGDLVADSVTSSDTKPETMVLNQDTNEAAAVDGTNEVLVEEDPLNQYTNEATAVDGNNEVLVEEDPDDHEESVGISRTGCSTSGTNLIQGEGEEGNATPEKQKQKEEADIVESQSRNRLLLEKLVEDNDRIMGSIAQLFERNEMQTRLLSSLSHRVEQLEKAYMCDKLRRKKRNATVNVITTDTFENLCRSQEICQ